MGCHFEPIKSHQPLWLKTKRPRSGRGLLIKKQKKKKVGALWNRHGPEFHGDPERSPEEGRMGGRRWEEHIWGREGRRRRGLVWFPCWQSPRLYPGFPAAGWEEGRLVSSRATQTCPSRDGAALWSYGNKTKSESAKVSDRGGGGGLKGGGAPLSEPRVI